MKKIEALIIDDNKEIAKMLSEFLKMEGYKCTSCSNGKIGLDMMLQHKFDVVLLDLAMPKFSGHDIIESLADSGKIKTLSFLLLLLLTAMISINF
jgi:two-component system OmpR family response regulator